MKYQLHSFQSAISKNHQLSQLISQAQSLSDIQSVVNRCLPEPHKGNCCASQFVGNILTIIVKNGSWLTKLRYDEEELIQALRKQAIFKSIKSITYRIDPTLGHNKTKESATA